MKFDPAKDECFPVDFEAALRHWLPGVKHCDRWRDYKRFSRMCAEGDRQMRATLGMRPPDHSPDFVNKEPLDRFAFVMIRDLFLRWRAIEIRKARSESGRKGGLRTAAAKAAAKKAKARKKPLTAS